MFETIIKAAENFCIHQIRDEYLISNDLTKDRTLVAYIDVNAHTGQKYRVYISAQKAFIQRVSLVFLEEDNSDDETLQDMLLETTNLIVGSAKVIAEESDISYNIETPFFEKDGVFDYEYDEIKTLQIKDDKISIAIKEF